MRGVGWSLQVKISECSERVKTISACAVSIFVQFSLAGLRWADFQLAYDAYPPSLKGSQAWKTSTVRSDNAPRFTARSHAVIRGFEGAVLLEPLGGKTF